MEKKTAESQGSALQFATGMNKKSHLGGCGLFFLYVLVFFKKNIQTIQCTFLAHTHIRTHRSGELQNNRHGNHKAWIVKRDRESPIPILNSHLAMKQQNDTR